MKRAGVTLADFLTGGNSSFKELPEAVVRKALEGYKDEISPAARVQEAFLRQAVCPLCKGTSFTRQFLGVGSGGREVTWVEGEAVPRPLLVCNTCEITFNPYSGIIVEPPPKRLVPSDE
jgi:hypothetical protein